MKMQNNDTKDEGLKGNEKIEEAIFAGTFSTCVDNDP